MAKISRRFQVRVTQTEIDTAIPANSGHCMIADAVKRTFTERYKRTPGRVSVDLQTIRVSDPLTRQKLIFLTPLVAQRALLQFDQKIKPTEFSFRMDAAQVLPMQDRTKQKQPRTEEQESQALCAVASATKRKRVRASVDVRASNGVGGTTPTKIGGKAPPTAVLSGNRRQFGIRAAGSLDGPTE